MATLRAVLAEAIAAMARNGYTSEAQVEAWAQKINRAAGDELPGDKEIDEETEAALRAVFERMIRRGGLIRRVPGVSTYDIGMIEPKFRAELDRRIRASADLIKLRKKETVAQTLARFRGWATSVPPGGSGGVDRLAARAQIAKPTAQYKFERRRVAIDQGHKLSANVAAIAALQSGAIAAIWHSHWRQPGYQYRREHKALDEKLFLIRGNWAQEKGWVKPAGHGYTDEIEAPAEKPYCSCYYQYINNPLDLPRDMLTAKGREALGLKEAA